MDLEELLGGRERPLGVVALERPGLAVQCPGEEGLVAESLRQLERPVAVGPRLVDPSGHRFVGRDPGKGVRGFELADGVEVGACRIGELERPGVVAGRHLERHRAHERVQWVDDRRDESVLGRELGEAARLGDVADVPVAVRREGHHRCAELGGRSLDQRQCDHGERVEAEVGGALPDPFERGEDRQPELLVRRIVGVERPSDRSPDVVDVGADPGEPQEVVGPMPP